MSLVPSVDLKDFTSGDSDRKQKFTKEIGKAFEEIGFVALSGHFLSEELVDNLYSEIKKFIKLPQDTKDGYEIEGVYLKLAALATQADQLRLFTLPTLTVAAVENNYQQQTWRERLDTGLVAAWQKLKGYIQVRRRDEIYKPLLAPEYEAAVRQNVRLMFEQSQMAVLAGKQNLYIDSLNKASQWLNDYYTIDNEKTALLTAQIDEIKALQIVAELPDISASLRALKNYVELIHDVKHPLTKATSQSAEQQKKAEITKGAQLGAKQ